MCVYVQIEGCVVGFVSLSDHIDLKLLNTCFELGAFEELRKTNSVDQTVKPEEPTPSEEEHLTSCVSVEVKNTEVILNNCFGAAKANITCFSA